MPGLRAEAGSRPGGRGTFLCFAKEKYPKERRPPVCDPFAERRGKPASCRLRGAPQNSLRACALRSNNCGESVHEARALRRACHPATAPPQAQPEGGWTAEQPTAEQPHGPLLRSAPSRGRKRHALRRPGRATRWPEWMFAGFPSVRAEKRRAGGACVCRRTHALRALTHRSCSSGAPQARSEFCGGTP